MSYRFVLVALLAVSSAQADTIYVDDDCPGPGDGSEADPYCSIQTAIDNAVDTDEIVVAGGTYIENIDFLGKAITVTSLDGPDVTIIDGGSPGPGDRPYTVTFQQGEGSDSRLEGFAVTNAFSVGSYGGIGCLESSPIISNCVIRDNIAEVGGGIGVTNGSPVIHGCLIIDNRAFGGVGVFASGSSSDALIVNCTIAHNTTLDGGANSAGGVMANGSAGVTIVNSVVWGNYADEGRQLVVRLGATLDVAYTDVEGGQSDVHIEAGGLLNWLDGNIDADPLFVDPDNGDFRLQPGSPCIDAGDNTAVPKGTTTDLDGNPRFIDDPDTPDTGFGNPPIVDMGAYEFQGASPCPWDCDGSESTDGTVGIVDFLTLLAQWGGPGSCDFDGGGVGINDFLALLANWGPCP